MAASPLDISNIGSSSLPPGSFEASSRATWGVFRGRCRFYLGKARVSKRKRDYVTKICFLVDLNLDFACKYGLWSLYYGTIGGDMGPRVIRRPGRLHKLIFLCRKIWGQPSHVELSFVGGALPTREQIYANLVLGQNKMMDFNQWSREEGLFTWVFARFSPEKQFPM